MTVHAAAPKLGLLLDVDGPIASPVSRTIANPSIVADLLELAAQGVPIVFNTGRSDAFIREQVAAPLIAGGLGVNARVHAVCEKGAVWCSIGPQFADGVGPVEVDAALALPREFGDAMQGLVADRFSDLMFFDTSKRAMVSLEQRVDVDNADYLARQPEFDALAVEALSARDLGVRYRDHDRPNSAGIVAWRVDPTIISTDIESIRSGKDLGADRALALLAEEGPLPRAWRTMGDSRSDYAMADWLHERGFEVAHVDVRPSDGIPKKPYAVLTSPDGVIHDDAGAEWLGTFVAA
ncbi:hypothetical protein [Curtobacterium ammoniigenes]|uniref:hypothetical protein n=1 Tax=Curtobacterium ammoniigenes TaxID=395387 RepID=UPI0008338473|nr:hypothetical protein [Curtobacterium ammoniigenes]